MQQQPLTLAIARRSKAVEDYEVKIMWNHKVFTVRVNQVQGADFAIKYVKDLHPGCQIMNVRLVR